MLFNPLPKSDCGNTWTHIKHLQRWEQRKAWFSLSIKLFSEISFIQPDLKHIQFSKLRHIALEYDNNENYNKCSVSQLLSLWTSRRAVWRYSSHKPRLGLHPTQTDIVQKTISVNPGAGWFSSQRPGRALYRCGRCSDVQHHISTTVVSQHPVTDRKLNPSIECIWLLRSHYTGCQSKRVTTAHVAAWYRRIKRLWAVQSSTAHHTRVDWPVPCTLCSPHEGWVGAQLTAWLTELQWWLPVPQGHHTCQVVKYLKWAYT